MYGLLHNIHTNENHKHVKGGFIHVPYCNEQVLDKPGKAYMPVEMIAHGLEKCIQAL
jgi:pyroglutamyl-peptidase